MTKEGKKGDFCPGLHERKAKQMPPRWEVQALLGVRLRGGERCSEKKRDFRSCGDGKSHSKVSGGDAGEDTTGEQPTNT